MLLCNAWFILSAWFYFMEYLQQSPFQSIMFGCSQPSLLEDEVTKSSVFKLDRCMETAVCLWKHSLNIKTSLISKANSPRRGFAERCTVTYFLSPDHSNPKDYSFY